MPVATDHIEIRWRRTDSVGQWNFMTIPPSQDAVTITGVERGVQYQIEARAVAQSGAASAWVAQTHIVSALALPPLAPTGLAATSLADGVHLTWLASDVQRSDVEYEIQRTADLSGAPDPAGWATLNRVRSLRYTDGVTDGVVRWYRVRAATYGGITTAFTSNVNSRGKTVEDGATLGAIIGPGGNVTGAVDTNGRATVDFSQSGHLNKDQDHVADGTTFKRLANVNADNTFHVSTSLNNQASALPSQVALLMFSMPDAATLIGTWLAQSFTRPDGSFLSVLASAGATLLTNGDMESGTVGSQETGWTNTSAFGLITVNTNVHGGSKAGNINNTSGATSVNESGSISLTAGQVYVLEGWVKTDALPNVPAQIGGGIAVTIVSGITSWTIITKFGAFDAGQTTNPLVALPANGVAHGYTFLQVYFIPAANGNVKVQCINQSNGGNCWFDDVKLYAHGGIVYRSLSASTGYYLYPYVEASTGLIKFTNGNPPGTSPSDSLASQCGLDGRYSLPSKKVTMPSAGGSGSDTGGGSGTCPEFSAPVQVRQYSDDGDLIFEGEMQAGEVRLGFESDDGEVKRGFFLKGYSFAKQQDVYRAVQHYMHVPCSAWMRIEGVRYTVCEMIFDNGKWVPAYKVTGAAHENSSGVKVHLQVEADWDDEHNFYAGTRLIHNAPILPC